MLLHTSNFARKPSFNCKHHHQIDHSRIVSMFILMASIDLGERDGKTKSH